VKVSLSSQAAGFLDSMPEGIDKAQILGMLERLGLGNGVFEECGSADYPGGRYILAGTTGQWKITYHVVRMAEPIISVVTIKKRRTLPWALDFRPKRSNRRE
jgi:hypothetical protein